MANYFGTPPADWVRGYLYFEPGAWIWTMGVSTLFAYCEKLIWKFFFKFNQGTCPWMTFAWNFFRIFWFFWGGSVVQIIYRGYIVFRGSNISCSLAKVWSVVVSLRLLSAINFLSWLYTGALGLQIITRPPVLFTVWRGMFGRGHLMAKLICQSEGGKRSNIWFTNLVCVTDLKILFV